MGVNIKGWNKKGDLIGDIVPEYVPPSLKNELEYAKEINSINNGYSKDKSFRKIGSIDPGAMYNYAMIKGVKPENHSAFWKEDNGKNLIAFLEEFPVYKVVDKPL